MKIIGTPIVQKTQRMEKTEGKSYVNKANKCVGYIGKGNFIFLVEFGNEN